MALGSNSLSGTARKPLPTNAAALQHRHPSQMERSRGTAMVRVRPQATTPARLGTTTRNHTRPRRRTMPIHHARRHTLR